MTSTERGTPMVDALVALCEADTPPKCSKEAFYFADGAIDMHDLNVLGSFFDLARTLELDLRRAQEERDAESAENAVLREQNFAMNKTIAAARQEAEQRGRDAAQIADSRDAWQEFAMHQMWCASCAEDVHTCPVGHELHTDANAHGAE